MSKKYKFTILGICLGFFVFLFSSSADAQQVRIDNFNVVQRTIPSAGSSVDFRLTISQQDQNLDCLNLPLTKGSLEWVVWYDVNGYVTTIRKQSVSLPLSPNPRNLDFAETIQPTQRAIDAGGMNFRATLGCDVLDVRNNLAVSGPVQVIVSGGGQVPPGGGQVPGQPGQPQTVTFEIQPPTAARSLIDLAKAIGRFLFQIAIPIAVIIIIYAGILFLTSAGNKEKITKARNALWYAVIGLTIILIGQGFFTLIKSILDLGGPATP